MTLLPVSFLQIFQPSQTIARLNDRAAKNKHQKNNNIVMSNKAIRVIIMVSFGIFVLANIFWMQHLLSYQAQETRQPHYLQRTKKALVQSSSSQSVSASLLRHYPPHRYYQLDFTKHKQPDFLTTETEYIYGQWPMLLPTLRSPTKLVVDQSEWLSTTSKNNNNNNKIDDDVLPFADGTNPSILTLQRLQQEQVAVWKLLNQHFPTAKYLATACMTDSQCSWNDSDADKARYHISFTQTQPDTVRTVLLLLDGNFQSLAQSTIYLQRDAPWGRKMRQAKPHAFYLPALDDARLFVYANQIWISYREGKGFGYESQVLNPVHLEMSMNNNSDMSNNNNNNKKKHQLHVTLKASETTSFCCGRNMALLSRPNTSAVLQAVTWVDPVTVEAVDTTPHIKQQQQQKSHNKKYQHRRLLSNGTNLKQQQQQQQQQQHKSHIHGTNAFMVQVPNNNNGDEEEQYLGVAHFHRPNDRKPNPYARFGHHYTHAFYTIRGDRLVGLSPEFVLPAAYLPDNAEIIQFVSGLEYIREADENSIVLAYGINDCEAAVVTVEWNQVQRMLRPVPPGKQVVDFMEPLSILQHK